MVLPSDVLGMMIYSPKDGTFQFKEGPISTNILLVDEINRGTPKTKSAFLQAMQEREVAVGDIIRPLPKPFMVLATMNPIEQEGVYPLIEAEKDRFMMKIKISYPSFKEEVEIVNQQSILGEAKINQVLELKELLEIQDFVKKIYVDPRLIKLASLITQKTRPEKNRALKEYVQLGASPRASMRIIEAARIQAFFEKNDYALPRHIRSVVHDVLRHRIILVTRPGKNVEEVIDDVIREVLDYEKE